MRSLFFSRMTRNKSLNQALMQLEKQHKHLMKTLLSSKTDKSEFRIAHMELLKHRRFYDKEWFIVTAENGMMESLTLTTNEECDLQTLSERLNGCGSVEEICALDEWERIWYD